MHSANELTDESARLRIKIALTRWFMLPPFRLMHGWRCGAPKTFNGQMQNMYSKKNFPCQLILSFCARSSPVAMNDNFNDLRCVPMV